MSTVTVTVTDRVHVNSPYNADFVRAARDLGGRWSGDDKTWSFDLRNESRVRETCVEYYGTDGEALVDFVTIQVKCSKWATCEEIVACGRTIIRRPRRDSDVRLGDGCQIISGGFLDFGGSMKYPALNSNDAVIEVFDVPRALAVAEAEDDDSVIVIEPAKDLYTIQGADGQSWAQARGEVQAIEKLAAAREACVDQPCIVDEVTGEVVDLEATCAKRTALEAERDRLNIRLAEIEAELK